MALLSWSHVEASCVEWHQLYSCENGQVALIAGHSWCGGREDNFYQLSITKEQALDHLSQLSRQEESSMRSFSLLESEQFGVFTFRLNPFVAGIVEENHQNNSLKIEMSFDSRKLGEYIFYDCNY